MNGEPERVTENGFSADKEKPVSLDELASRVGKEHDQFCNSVRSSFEHAIAAGQLLKRAKCTVLHGKWHDWIEKKCNFSHRTATNYIKLAEHQTEVRANSQRVANLSVRAMLALLPSVRKPRGTATDGSAGSRDAAQTLDELLNKIEMLGSNFPSECKILVWTSPATDPDVTALRDHLVASSEARGCTVRRRNRVLIITRADEQKRKPAPIIPRSDDFAATPFESELPASVMVEADLPYSMPVEDA